MADRSGHQARVIEAYSECGTVRGAARELGLDPTNVRRTLRRAGVLKKELHAAVEAPNGQTIQRTTTLIKGGKDDPFALQWVRVDADKAAKLEAFEDAIKLMCDPIVGAAEPTKAPKFVSSDLMCVIPIGDPHVGLLAWATETGESWDLKIAERVLISAVERVVSVAPAGAECLLINLGDFFHTDSQANVTGRSGHQLDVDSRWAKMLEIGIRIYRRMVEICLTKFSKVTVDTVIGNHDDHTSIMLAHVMRAYFERDPRVVVPVNPALHHYFEFGKCMIGTHHGHTAKFQALPLLAAASQSAMWGRTGHRKIYCGHVHHDSLKEFPGVKVETFNTLAARDAYAAGAGYMSERDLNLDVWHKERGRIARHTVNICELEESGE